MSHEQYLICLPQIISHWAFLIQPTGPTGSQSCLVSVLHHVGGPCSTTDRLTLATACAWHFSFRQATHAGGQFWPALVQILVPKKKKKHAAKSPSHVDKYKIIYIYTQSVCANGTPKRIDQQLHKLSRLHRSLRECLDRLSTPDGPSRPSAPLSVCQGCLLASLLPHCCWWCCLGPFPWPVVTRHEQFFYFIFYFLPVLSNECTSFPLHLQRICRCRLVYLENCHAWIIIIAIKWQQILIHMF